MTTKSPVAATPACAVTPASVPGVLAPVAPLLAALRAGQMGAALAWLRANRTAMQALRFAIGGGVVTLISSGIYLACAVRFGVSAQLANLIAYLISVMIGYVIHRYWSFADQGVSHAGLAKALRFFGASLSSLAMTASFAFVFVTLLGLSKGWPAVTMVFVTPLAVFWVNKNWVFRS
jgi:putative flippase GtrA